MVLITQSVRGLYAAAPYKSCVAVSRGAAAVLSPPKGRNTPLNAANSNFAYLGFTSKLKNAYLKLNGSCTPTQCIHRLFFSVSKAKQGIVTFKLADLGEGIHEVELLKWHKNEGEEIAEMEDVCEVQSDKAAVEITSRYTGKIVKLHHQVGDTLAVGTALMDIDSPDHEDSAVRTPQTPPATPLVENSSDESAKTAKPRATSGVRASPAVRQLDKDKGIDLGIVEGTGKGGIVTKEDLLAALKNPIFPHESGFLSPAASLAPADGDVVVSLKGIGKAMVKSMKESLSTPQMNIGDEYDVTKMLKLRNTINKHLSSTQKNCKISITTLLIKAMSIALKKYPILNSKFNSQNQAEYTQFANHNFSIAVDTPSGLLVPTVREIQKLDLFQIQLELLRIQELAKANKLAPSDFSGGTFAISNVGVISGTYIHPILYDGQAVIAGVGQVISKPRFSTENILEERQILYCSYTADHRHCDGATVARFSKSVKELLENPEVMLAYLR